MAIPFTNPPGTKLSSTGLSGSEGKGSDCTRRAWQLDFKVDFLGFPWMIPILPLTMKPVFPLVCLLVLCVPAFAESIQRRSPVSQALAADAVGSAQLLFKRGLEMDGIIHTKFLFRAGESLRGKLPEHFEVLSPGGVLGGQVLRDSRLPSLKEGTDYFLFLKVRNGNLWFYNGTAGARPLVGVLPIFQARIRALPGEGKDLSSFAVQPRITMASTTATGLIESDGSPMRYVNPDRGELIPVYADVSTLPTGISQDDAISVLQAAIKAWEDNSSFRFKYMGTAVFTQSAETYGYTGSAILRVQFHDNWNHISDGSDTLAIGGSSFSIASGYGGTVSNVQFHPAAYGYVLVNHPKTHLKTKSTLEEVITHELGHALGMAHSSEDPDETDADKLASIMYYLNKGDGTGSLLRAWDITTIQKAYPITNTPPYGYDRAITAVTVPSSGNLVNFNVNQVAIGGHDLDGDTLSIQTVQNEGQNGVFSVNGTTVTYTPNGYFSDTLVSDTSTQFFDIFYYRITDGTNYSPVYTVRILGFLSDSKPDNAQDGLPDSWMTTHFGSTTGSTDSDDPDGDGQDNLQEFIQGTDPNDSDSNFVLQEFDGTSLNWASQQFGLYIIERSTDLLNWSTFRVRGQGTGTESSLSFSDIEIPASGNMFYRVVRSP
jgi:hypothetical protein